MVINRSDMRAAPPTAPIKWYEVETLLNIVVLCNQCGPNANNISRAAREVLYELNESLYPEVPPEPPIEPAPLGEPK